MFLDILMFVSLLLCSIFMIFEGQCERSFGTPVEQHHNNKRVKQVNITLFIVVSTTMASLEMSTDKAKA